MIDNDDKNDLMAVSAECALLLSLLGIVIWAIITILIPLSLLIDKLS